MNEENTSFPENEEIKILGKFRDYFKFAIPQKIQEPSGNCSADCFSR